MRTQNKIAMLLLLSLAVIFQACKSDDPEIGEPWSHVEGLTNTAWRLVEVEIIDEGNPARPRRSLSKFFTSTDDRMTIDFSTDGSFVSVPGEGGQVLPLSGTWAFDLNEAPRRIFLDDGEQVITANLGAPVRPVDQQLRIELVKRSCEVDGETIPALSYQFIFDRQS